MRYSISLVLFLATFVTVGCGWHLRDNTITYTNLKTVIFDSEDINSCLNQAISNRLRLNGIKLIKKKLLNQNVPYLHVLTSNLSKDVVSIFQNGVVAEYQMILLTSIEILMPNKKTFKVSSKIYRSFFNDSQSILAKDVKQQTVIDEMYNEAAEELVSKLFNINKITEKSSY